MRAEEVAELLQARRSGSGKWQARCPAHEDRSPSLSIREGHDGRVLIHCFAGCTLTAMLAILGLRMRDLYVGPPPSPQQAAKAAQERARRNVEALQARQEERRLADRYRRLNAVLDEVAARLARMPEGIDSEMLASLFHSTLGKIRAIEELFDAGERRVFHEKLVRLGRKSEQAQEAL